MKGFKNHPYIPNSVPEIQQQMLGEIGLQSLEDLHAEIPEQLKLKENLNLPKALSAESTLRRHVEQLLEKNKNCQQNLNFLGAGCWQHYVPSICDEINSRGEFLTAYGGEMYNDFGRFQALFEYQSMVGELVGMDVVNVPTMDWGQAAATSLRMASRITGRKKIIVPTLMDREKFLIMKNYCEPDITLILAEHDVTSGLLDREALKAQVTEEVAAVYIENPGYLGFIEENGAEIAQISHDAGALFVVGVDPISLGVLQPPSEYGADIICGDLQPLGMHMQYGGGQAGFIATRDEEKFVMEYPSRLFGIVPTTVEGEYGFDDIAYDRTSFGHHREQGKEYVGTQAALWGITAGVYLATMGPVGMADVGKTIMQNVQYAMQQLSTLSGISVNPFSAVVFKEFVVDFSACGMTVKQINQLLLEKGIFGGKDLSTDLQNLGQAALYCVTEIHSKKDIDTLVSALQEIIE
ncbi:MAG: aminomethyl-transferring glycine dehydrogenase [Desulfobulbus propionicus]|nr:MAG: aminomethyl-transferring glycine dehydrogenase [Desulfobulbus propionicus]